jgi:hypothetical protein
MFHPLPAGRHVRVGSFATGSSRELAGHAWHAPTATDFCGAAKFRDVPITDESRIVIKQEGKASFGNLRIKAWRHSHSPSHITFAVSGHSRH